MGSGREWGRGGGGWAVRCLAGEGDVSFVLEGGLGGWRRAWLGSEKSEKRRAVLEEGGCVGIGE